MTGRDPDALPAITGRFKRARLGQKVAFWITLLAGLAAIFRTDYWEGFLFLLITFGTWDLMCAHDYIRNPELYPREVSGEEEGT